MRPRISTATSAQSKVAASVDRSSHFFRCSRTYVSTPPRSFPLLFSPFSRGLSLNRKGLAHVISSVIGHRVNCLFAEAIGTALTRFCSLSNPKVIVPPTEISCETREMHFSHLEMHSDKWPPCVAVPLERARHKGSGLADYIGCVTRLYRQNINRKEMTRQPAHRIASLDGLRALSILLVIVGHLWGGNGHAVILSIFGVQIFFVLSGYLITTLLQREYEREGRINLLAFYRRRAFRIFPAAYAYIIVIAIISPQSRSGLIYAATYTVSYHYITIPVLFQHLWSLSVEEQFYLLWPLSLLLGFRYRAYIAWLAMLLAAAFRLALAFNPSPLAIFYMHFSVFGTMDSIAAGCLLAIYEPTIRRRFLWMAQPTAISIALPLTAWAIAGALAGDTNVLLVRSMSALLGIVPLLIALWMFLLIERQDAILNTPVAKAIGVLSYSLYLWQQPFSVSHKFSTVQVLVMIAFCAIASYLLIERPMLQLGAKISAASDPIWRRRPLASAPSNEASP